MAWDYVYTRYGEDDMIYNIIIITKLNCLPEKWLLECNFLVEPLYQ